MNTFSNRDWPEDFSDENGNYLCQCAQCNQQFFSYKRRVVCKVCDGENRVRWNAMTASEQAEARRKFESDFIHIMVMGHRPK